MTSEVSSLRKATLFFRFTENAYEFDRTKLKGAKTYGVC